MQERLPVRSYVLRGGRTTPAQSKALETLWPQFGIELSDGIHIDFQSVFKRRAPVVLDIGFGNGESVYHAALMHPDEDIIGVEVHQPGVGALLLKVAEAAASNIRVIRADAVEILTHHIASSSLSAVRLYFPDPWPKKRHHKRRLVQPGFVSLVADRLIPGGTFHLATDWAPYAEHMLETLTACAALENCSPDDTYIPRPDIRPVTRFERRGLKYDQPAHDLLFERRAVQQ